MVEEDTIVGDVFVRTTYERFTLPVYMRVAHGRISLKKLIFIDCFPVSHSCFHSHREFIHIDNLIVCNLTLYSLRIGIDLRATSKDTLHVLEADGDYAYRACK